MTVNIAGLLDNNLPQIQKELLSRCLVKMGIQ